VWNPSYKPTWMRSPSPQLSLPIASAQSSPSLTMSMGKKRRSHSVSPTRLTSSSAPKKIKLQFPFPLQETPRQSAKSASHPLQGTPLLCKHSSTLCLYASELPPAQHKEGPSSKMTSMMSLPSYRWPTRSGILTEELKAKMMSLLDSCPSSTKFGGPVPPHQSFIACSCQRPSPPRIALFPSQLLPADQSSLLPLGEWFLNQMLPSDAVPVVTGGRVAPGLVWCSRYFQYRDTFRAQLSLCLLLHHDSLTHHHHSALNTT
jgi:hypothetical protein